MNQKFSSYYLLDKTMSDDADVVNIPLTEYLDNTTAAMKLPRCENSVEMLEAEDDDGKIEYKLKLSKVTGERLQHLITQMQFRLREGLGEAIYRIGVDDNGYPRGLNDRELRSSLHTLQCMCVQSSAQGTIVKRTQGAEGVWVEVLVRKSPPSTSLDVRVCVIGKDSAGKSTLVGVLTFGQLDDGDGLARLNVLRHRHEIEMGTTSSISVQLLGFDAEGSVMNATDDSDDDFLDDNSWSRILDESAKVLTLIDLAGHERYMKTTVFGLTGRMPDYAMVTVDGACSQLDLLTSNHITMCAALGIPLFVVITKTDLPQQNPSLLDELRAALDQGESSVVSKALTHVRTEADAVKCAHDMCAKLICPVLSVSCVTGHGLDVLKAFLGGLAKPENWVKMRDLPAIFQIEECFSLADVGTVVSGIVLQGRVEVGDTLLLGPMGACGENEQQQFEPVRIKGIHVQRAPMSECTAGQASSLALHRVSRDILRRGMVLVHSLISPHAVKRFDASIYVLQESIHVNNEPILHIGTVRQVARIISIRELPRNNNGSSSSNNNGNNNGVLRRQRSQSDEKHADSGNKRVYNSNDKRDDTHALTPIIRSTRSPPSPSSAVASNDNDNAFTLRVDSDQSCGVLSVGDHALVTFEFCHRVEFVRVGTKFIFRDNKHCKGIGMIAKIYLT